MNQHVRLGVVTAKVVTRVVIRLAIVFAVLVLVPRLVDPTPTNVHGTVARPTEYERTILWCRQQAQKTGPPQQVYFRVCIDRNTP